MQTVYRGSTTTNSSSSKKGGVIYIDTELKFDPVRLIDVAACRFPETYSTELNEDATRQIDNFLDSVKVPYHFFYLSSFLFDIYSHIVYYFTMATSYCNLIS